MNKLSIFALIMLVLGLALYFLGVSNAVILLLASIILFWTAYNG